ncbi:MAG TPA: hypothetical protein VK745_00635 [Polyangiaceae bacterium]|nr:hypothetical protein [Polyangiaceae bacterium]
MDRVDFWQLGRSIQERFVESAKGGSAPTPLAVRPLGRDSRVLAWGALGLCSFVAAVFALRMGFGELGSRYALTPVWFCAVYGGLFALSAFGFLKAAVRHVSAYAVPYRPALYLFPIGVIDARAPHFAVHRVSERTQVTVDGARRCLRVQLDDANFEFPAHDLALTEQAAQTVNALRDRLANAGPDSSAREQSLVDPLVDNGFKNPFSPPESMRRAVPMWVKSWPLLALVFGVLLGGVSWRVRNALSEAKLYAAARSADRTETYRDYLARGGHNPDVEALLLPRAELRDAEAKHSVVAIEEFVTTHPDSKIQNQVDAALHQALLNELATAEAVATLTALKDFAARYARYPFLGSDIDRAIDARIQATLQQLKPALAPGQSRLLPFFERLLRYTAKHGPELAVRFQRKSTESLEMAEKALRMSAYFTGEKSLPGQYFDDAHDAPREAVAAAALANAFAEHFPRDLLDAKAAPTLDDAADTKPKVPTLLVSYRTEMSGAFTSKKPRFAVSGIGIFCKVSFEIPGDSEALPFKFSVWRAPDLKSVTDTTTPPELYEAMAAEAFKRFDKKYLATLFVEH